MPFTWPSCARNRQGSATTLQSRQANRPGGFQASNGCGCVHPSLCTRLSGTSLADAFRHDHWEIPASTVSHVNHMAGGDVAPRVRRYGGPASRPVLALAERACKRTFSRHPVQTSDGKVNRTDQPGARGVLLTLPGRLRRPTLNLRAHTSTGHPLTARRVPAGNISGMSHLDPEAAASARLRWHRPYQTSCARPKRAFDGGRAG